MQLRELPEELLADSWELDGEQRILVGAALDIWDDSGHVFLSELLNDLNEQNFRRLIFAANEYRALKERRSIGARNESP